MRAKKKAAMMSKKAKKGSEDDEARVMEDVHNDLCEGAAPFIVGFENVNRGDRPCTADGSEKEIIDGVEVEVSDIDWFLGLTFPDMGVKEDAEGNTVMQDGTDDDGKPIKTPEFEMKNNPFAKQIGEFAAKQANFLGKTKKA
jgi:hypothetical protein